MGEVPAARAVSALSRTPGLVLAVPVGPAVEGQSAILLARMRLALAFVVAPPGEGGVLLHTVVAAAGTASCPPKSPGS